MSLEVLARVGTSANSGAPIHRVRCSECGDVFLRTGQRSHIEAQRWCSTCAHAAKRIPDARRLRNARRYQGAARLPVKCGTRPRLAGA